MSDEDWQRLADAELTHDRQCAEIEVDHLHGAPRLHRVLEGNK
jgi:hypothetical protein